MFTIPTFLTQSLLSNYFSNSSLITICSNTAVSPSLLCPLSLQYSVTIYTFSHVPIFPHSSLLSFSLIPLCCYFPSFLSVITFPFFLVISVVNPSSSSPNSSLIIFQTHLYNYLQKPCSQSSLNIFSAGHLRHF